MRHSSTRRICCAASADWKSASWEGKREVASTPWRERIMEVVWASVVGAGRGDAM